jgi:putative phosphoesterase
MCHGHRYSVYYDRYRLIAAAAAANADVALFGHTHVPFSAQEGGIYLINPGSVGRPRSRQGATFALIDCEPGKPPEAVFYKVK